VLIGKCIKFTQDFAKFHVERFMHRLGPGRKEACVYVHGFNNRFVKAAKKMALCGYKMQAESPLFMFSWPSYQVGMAFCVSFLFRSLEKTSDVTLLCSAGPPTGGVSERGLEGMLATLR
jgi:hypothetical protein